MPTEVSCPTDDDTVDIEAFTMCGGFAAAYPTGGSTPAYTLELFDVVYPTGCGDLTATYPPDLYLIETQTLSREDSLCVCCECQACACSGYWSSYTFDVAGVTGPDGNCSTPDSCGSYNGTWLVNHLSQCSWITDELSVCDPGFPTYALSVGFYGPGTAQILVICAAGTAGSEWRSDDWTCECGGTFTLIPGSPLCCANWPTTLTVTPAGTWTTCGLPEPTCEDPPTMMATATAERKNVTAEKRKVELKCIHLGETVRVAGSSRTWKKCNGGYGSPADTALGKDIAGLVCGCATASSGEWRIGRECGSTCGGYQQPGENGDAN